ncbi:sensor histidine kinase [Cellulomonas sp. URHD0024]|uniref:sensor histidine kinase n=1 Tax=Cellulomonas sp. URHD0024 TaxID=1302620 RepID=UPI0009DC15B8|nr:sensor histidine kinase [Cellulomonas sp. URHD0024]
MTTDDCIPRAWYHRLGNALTGFLGVLILITVWAGWHDPDQPLPGWLLPVIGAASLGGFLLVGRWPVLAGAVTAVLSALSPVAGPASYTTTLVAARWNRLSTALWAAGMGALGTAVRALWWPGGVGVPLQWWLIGDVAVHAALFAWGALWRTRAELMASLRERARRAEAEQEQRVEQARTAERTRIAREMHDTLAHRLTLVATTAGALEFRTDLTKEQVASAAGVVRANASEALEELRTVIGVLRTSPDELRPTPGLADVPRLVDETRGAGVDVRLDVADLELPTALDLAVYRACQEGLTNARRHAPGSRVTVNVAVDDGLRVVVANDQGGKGETNGTGTGLIGLTERVELLGGQVHAGPAGEGFRLEAWIPWEP